MALHLVTGGSGFLGSMICRKLLQSGHEVRSLDLVPDPQASPAITFFRGSILDRAQVRRAMEGVEVVHHQAALVPLARAGKTFFRVNTEGSRIVAEEAVSAGVKFMAHTSSSAIFGAEGGHISPSQIPTPSETYGESKYQGEIILREICERAGIRCTVIRPRTILGPGRLGIFQILFDWIHEGRRIYILGKGDNRLQFVHIDDLLDFYFLAVEKKLNGTFNVGTDRYETLREDLEALIRHAGTQSRVTPLPIWPAACAMRVLDTLRLSPLTVWHYLTYHKPFSFDLAPLLALGWKPRYSNQEMLIQSYDHFLKNPPLKNSPSTHRSRTHEGLLWLLKQLP